MIIEGVSTDTTNILHNNIILHSYSNQYDINYNFRHEKVD